MEPRRLITPLTHGTILGTGVISIKRSTPCTYSAFTINSRSPRANTRYCSPTTGCGAAAELSFVCAYPACARRSAAAIAAAEEVLEDDCNFACCWIAANGSRCNFLRSSLDTELLPAGKRYHELPQYLISGKPEISLYRNRLSQCTGLSREKQKPYWAHCKMPSMPLPVSSTGFQGLLEPYEYDNTISRHTANFSIPTR